MSHELAHNLGSIHDTSINQTIYNCSHDHNMMYPSAGSDARAFLVSQCTILQLKEKLFEKTDQLAAEFNCLLHKPTLNKQVYSKISREKLPGFYYSLSEQCRIFTKDHQSYACGRRFNDCDSLKCYIKNECNVVSVSVLDGSECASGKYCYLTECLRWNQKLVYGSYKLNRPNVGPTNLNDIYAARIRTECPAGVSQESLMMHSDMLNRRTITTCDDLILGTNITIEEQCNAENRMLQTSKLFK
jgi:hypothetical protein